MSATQRGAPRMFLDDYPTPSWAIRRALEKMPFLPSSGSYLDPCAGSGHLLSVIKKFSPQATTAGIEIQNKYINSLESSIDEYQIADYLKVSSKPKADVIFTNPPYRYALEFIKEAITQAPHTIMLLRINFLGSQKRHDFLKNHMPDMYVLPNRPSFTDGGTDACEYAWFHFLPSPRSKGKVIMLDSTPKKERVWQD